MLKLDNMELKFSIPFPKWLAKLGQHKVAIGWTMLVVLDILAIVYTYWPVLTNLPSHKLNTYCSGLPVDMLLGKLLQPRYLFLTANIFLLGVLALRLATLPTVRLHVNRLRVEWLLPIILLGLLLVTLFLITKLSCWS